MQLLVYHLLSDHVGCRYFCTDLKSANKVVHASEVLAAQALSTRKTTTTNRCTRNTKTSSVPFVLTNQDDPYRLA